MAVKKKQKKPFVQARTRVIPGDESSHRISLLTDMKIVEYATKQDCIKKKKKKPICLAGNQYRY